MDFHADLHMSLEEPEPELIIQNSLTLINNTEDDIKTDEERLLYSYYINPCFNSSSSIFSSKQNCDQSKDDIKQVKLLSSMRLQEAIEELDLQGKWMVEKTHFGLVMVFSRKEEAEEMLEKVDLAKVLGMAVQVATMSNFAVGGSERKCYGSFRNSGLGRYNKPSPRRFLGLNHAPPPSSTLIVRDVPWSIPAEEIQAALAAQGINVSMVERYRQHIRIEVKQIFQYEKLLSEGLNFYNVARFLVTNERPPSSGSSGYQTGNNQQDDALQCYRCQGFWHVAVNCKQLPRCVRCGEPHGAEQCFRPRSNPICCNCFGAHHAAYKLCPVRREVLQSFPVGFTLSFDRPNGSSSEVTPNLLGNHPRCML